MKKFTEKEQELFVLHIVKSIEELSEQENISFKESMENHIFIDKANTSLTELICKTMETLHNKGYISGELEIVYEIECIIDNLDDETETDNIDVAECVMNDISITAKGKLLFTKENLINISSDFLEKAKPVIKKLPTIALQTVVELSVIAMWKAIGFPV